MLTPLFDTLQYINEPNIHITNQLKAYEVAGVDDVFLCYELALEYLDSCSGSEATFKSYRAEIEKFLFWCWHVKAMGVAEVNKMLLRSYLQFVRKPDGQYIGKPTNSRFVTKPDSHHREPNANWRPFVNPNWKKEGLAAHYKFTDKSLSLTLSVLTKFFEHLIDSDYTERNPAAILRKKPEYKRTEQNTEDDLHFFTKEQWAAILNIIDANNPQDVDRGMEVARRRFIIKMMYSLYPRISEISARPAHTPVMGDFSRNVQHDAFVFRIPISKGFKGRTIPVSDELISHLNKYREALGFSPTLSSTNSYPLFPKIVNGKPVMAGLGQRQIYNIITEVFYAAADLLEDQGNHEMAAPMREATPHWLRHTGISHDLNYHGVPLTVVRDNAGHSSIDTTSLYLHTSLSDRYLSVKGKKISPE